LLDEYSDCDLDSSLEDDDTEEKLSSVTTPVLKVVLRGIGPAGTELSSEAALLDLLLELEDPSPWLPSSLPVVFLPVFFGCSLEVDP